MNQYPEFIKRAFASHKRSRGSPRNVFRSFQNFSKSPFARKMMARASCGAPTFIPPSHSLSNELDIARRISSSRYCLEIRSWRSAGSRSIGFFRRITATSTGPRQPSLFPKAARPAAPCATYCYHASVLLQDCVLTLHFGIGVPSSRRGRLFKHASGLRRNYPVSHQQIFFTHVFTFVVDWRVVTVHFR